MHPMHRTNRTSIRWMLAGAAAGPVLGLLAASPAYAQYQVPQDGSARDANNRVGSGGRNGGPPASYGAANVTPNQLVNGNVTGGREFRGPTASTDARAFRGTTATVTSDRFVRGSVGGYDGGTLAQSANLAPRAYYGDSRAVAPPSGYVSPVYSLSTGMTQSTTLSGQANAANLGGLQTGEGLVPRIGTTTTVIGGPQDPNTGAAGSYLVLSPLSGIRAVTPDQLGGYTVRGSQLVPNASGDRFRTDGGGLVDRMRSELSDPGQANPGGPGINGAGPTNGGTAPGQPPAGQGTGPQGATPVPGVTQPLGQPLRASPETPVTPNLGSGTQLNNTLGTGGQTLGSALATGQSVRRRLSTAAQQSQQYGELERRRRQAEGDQPLTDQQAQQQFRSTQAAASRPAAPGTPAAPAVPGAPAAPGNPPPAAIPPASLAPAAARQADPVVITSLATGVASPTLAGVLRQAEDQMKAGKFAAALDQYALAEQAAPNNPLIAIGRANAELGASTYRTAEGHLRQAFQADQALLMGRYDLQAFLGKERVELLVRDLTELSATEPADPMAPFLLGYILYNTGDASAAAARLAEAEKRQGGADQTVKLMRQRWALPAAAGQNK